MHRSMGTLKICHSGKHGVDGTSMCMPILTLVLRNSFSHYYFFFSKPVYLRVTIKFWGKFQKIVIFGQKCFFFFFHQKKFDFFFFGSNCSSFILQLKAENRINIRAVFNEIHVFKLFCMGFIW